MKLQAKTVCAIMLACPLLSATPQLITKAHWVFEDLNGLANRQVIQLDLSTFPLSKSEVKRALDEARPQTQSDYLVIQRIRAGLQDKRDGFTLEVEGQSKLNVLRQSADGYFNYLSGGYDRYRSTFKQSFNTGELDLYLQGNIYSGETAYRLKKRDLAGSYLALKADNQLISVGMQQRVWGSAHFGSLMLSDIARPFPAVSLQRDKQKPSPLSWLSWLGRWQYQMFIGKPLWRDMEHVYSSGRIYGVRLSAQPLEPLEIGVSYLYQSTNLQDGEVKTKKASQRNGIDARLRLSSWLDLPISLYGQAVRAEQTGQSSDYAYLLGIDGSHHLSHRQTLNWFIEAVESQVPTERLESDLSPRFYQKLPISYHWGGEMRALAIGTNSVYRNNDVTALVKHHHWQSKLFWGKLQDGVAARDYVGAEIGWAGDIPLDKYISLKVDTSLWWLKERTAKKTKSNVGVSSKASVEF